MSRQRQRDLIAEAEVASLPRRTAHALYALLAIGEDNTRELTRQMPTSAEVLLYDPESLSARSTGAALTHAARLGLCGYVRPYWMATGRAHALRSELEERCLREQEEERGWQP